MTAASADALSQRVFELDFADAIALRVISGADGSAWVTWSESEAVQVGRIDLDSGELGQAVKVSGDEGVFAHPIERPSMTVSGDGTAFVAWISGLGDVRLAMLGSDGEVLESQSISGEVRDETVLVHMTTTNSGPLLSWLEDSTLSVALPDEAGTVIEHDLVDDQTCDCCHPVPVVMGDRVGVGYRNADTADGRTVRDIHFVTGSLDGHGFGDSVAIADDHWFLEACPFSGLRWPLQTAVCS